MKEVFRVFYHELGHFIAQELNEKFYQGPGVKKIILFQSPIKPEFFEGKTILNKNDFPTKEKLFPFLASSVYGCILQAFFKNETLDDCFIEHGKRDSEQWNNCITKTGYNGYQPDFFACEKKYFETLKAKGALENLKKLKPDNYLIIIDHENYRVEIDLLRKDTIDFLNEHKSFYFSLINDYQKIVDDHEQKNQ